MAKTYGYCRISTSQQNIERQIRNIKDSFPDAIIVTEAYTGTKISRPEWNKVYALVASGDTIVFDSVSRMSRDAEDGFRVYQELYEKGINLIFLKEPHINTEVFRNAGQKQIDLTLQTGTESIDRFGNALISAVNELLLDLAKEQIRLAFLASEHEVMELRTRTKEGMETARLNGKQIGQKRGRKLHVKKAETAKEVIRKHSKSFGGSLTDEECMALAKVSHNAYYRYKREIKEEMEDGT